MFRRLAAKALRTSPALVHAEQAGVGEFATRRILVHALASRLGTAADVQQIIGDLEGQSETATVAVQGVEQSRVGAVGLFALRRVRAHAKTGAEQSTRL